MDFPVIDCSKIQAQSPMDLDSLLESKGFQTFTQEFGKGMSTVGFVYLKNHGIPKAEVDNFLLQSKRFFELALEKKMKYKKIPSQNFHGYTPQESGEVSEIYFRASEKDKSIPDFKEGFNFFSWDILDPEKYPSEVPELYPSVQDFFKNCSQLGKIVLLSLAQYLDLEDPRYFLQRHKSLDAPEKVSFGAKGETTPFVDMRTNWYPPVPAKEESQDGLQFRLSNHSDWGTITFVFQDDVGGLQAKGVDGKWHDVKPIEDTIVVNAGLMLELWSGGNLPATEHRVRLVKSNKLRQSLSFFIAPDGETEADVLVKKKDGWTFTDLYPSPGKQTYTQYINDRIKGIYGSNYY